MYVLGAALFVIAFVVTIVGAQLFFYWLDRQREDR